MNILKENCLALDISTTACGIAYSGCNNKIIAADFILIEGDNLLDKFDSFKKGYYNFLSKNSAIAMYDNIVIEAPLLNIKTGFSNKKTLMNLYSFNFLIQNFFHQKYNKKPKLLNVKSVRSKLGIKDKADVVAFVEKEFPEMILPKNKKHATDVCDAIVLLIFNE